MIINANIEGHKVMGINIPALFDVDEDISIFRDAVLDVLGVCLSNDETKDTVKSITMYILTETIKELNKDIEQLKTTKQ